MNDSARYCTIQVDVDGLWVIGKLLGRDFSGESDPVFDTGIDSLLKIFYEFGVKATFFIVAKDLESNVNREIVKRIIESGHEIASHSISHRALTTLKENELDLELRAPAKNLGSISLVYPGGAYNQQVKQVARKYYWCARTAEKGINELPIKDWFGLKTFMLTKNKNLYHKLKQERLLKSYIKETKKKSAWLILSYHLVSDKNKKYKFTTTTREFKKHLKWVLEASLKITTLKEFKNSLS